MSFEPRESLRHILVEAEFLIRHSQGLTFEPFDNDETLRRAFVRRLEVIGEAVKKLPTEFRAQHPEVEWRQIAGAGSADPRVLRRQPFTGSRKSTALERFLASYRPTFTGFRSEIAAAPAVFERVVNGY